MSASSSHRQYTDFGHRARLIIAHTNVGACHSFAVWSVCERRRWDNSPQDTIEPLRALRVHALVDSDLPTSSAGEDEHELKHTVGVVWCCSVRVLCSNNTTTAQAQHRHNTGTRAGTSHTGTRQGQAHAQRATTRNTHAVAPANAVQPRTRSRRASKRSASPWCGCARGRPRTPARGTCTRTPRKCGCRSWRSPC